MADDAARAAIQHVPSWFCAQKMVRGDARRWAARGQTYCYVIACPKCGRACQHTVEEMGLVEGPMTTSSAPFGAGSNPTSKDYEHPVEMTSTRDSRCPGCGGKLRCEGREVVTTPPRPPG